MHTNNIKSFAKEARLILMDGVIQRLKYWGFDEDGTNDQTLESTQGGYIFRGQIFTDTTVPDKWRKLKKKLSNKQDVLDVVEEAAYTWFNRLMAIKILESNGYISEQISYSKGMRTPKIVQKAKRGEYELKNKANKELLLEYLQEDKEEQAFGLLITNLCNSNQLLHDVFGHINDYTEILLPQNLMQTNGLLDLINSDAISTDDYKEVELIGWLYQFYISDKKDEVFKGFKKNIKARAEDIPAATQIFTPKWIVKYMVENTVGKIYLDYEPDSDLRQEMKYLVENKDSSPSKGEVARSAGEVQSLISDITQLTLLDPACGSGHILVTGFELLFKMYREEGYTAKQAVEKILKNNLYGLDIDDRAMQLARFAVLLKAAKYDVDVLGKGLMPNVYSFPETTHFTNEEIQNFLGYEGHQYVVELKEALQLLNQGKNIGSALKLSICKEALTHIKQQYQNWTAKNTKLELDVFESEFWNRIKSFLDVLLVLTKQYITVIANPPYLSQRKMNGELKFYLNTLYPKTKTDLFAVFMEVLENLGSENGFKAIINQHSWMFLSTFDDYRLKFLETQSILSMLHLGPRTFEELGGEVVQSTALVFSKKRKTVLGSYHRLLKYKNNESKEKAFFKRQDLFKNINQNLFHEIPKSPISYWVSKKFQSLFKEGLLEDLAHIKVGIDSGNNKRFLRYWHEVSIAKFNDNAKSGKTNAGKWFPYNKGGVFKKWYGNKDYVLNWENDGKEVKLTKNSNIRSKHLQFKKSLSWSLLAGSSFGVRYFKNGFLFDNNGRSIIFKNNNDDEKYLDYLNGYLNSKLSYHFLSALNPTLAFQVGDLKRVPFLYDEDKLFAIDEISKNALEISVKDWNSREISWDFEESPTFNKSISLKKAYLNWKEQVVQDFFQLHANEEELNRIFIDIYGLQEELTPEVAIKDITILQEELDKKDLEALETTFREKGKDGIELPIKKEVVFSQFVNYLIGIMMGRYRLDKPGLNIAHPNPTSEELSNYTYNNHTIEMDKDAILPLMGENCAFPDDALGRTKDLLLAIWGEDSLTENINFLQEALGMDLHKWLTEKFWTYHSKKMYKKKPIYWLFSSNVKKSQNAAFKVLVYMHRMDKYTVQKIQRNYLHPHQEYIKQELKKYRENENNLNREEQKHFEILQNWELECRDYNEVLKELANQQIEFDLDDGVTVNYARFEGAVANI